MTYKISYTKLPKGILGRTTSSYHETKVFIDKAQIEKSDQTIEQVIRHELWHVVFLKFPNINSHEQIVRIICQYESWVNNEIKQINSTSL